MPIATMHGAINMVGAKGLIWEPESYFKIALDHIKKFHWENIPILPEIE